MRKTPDKNCIRCGGRGVYLRSTGKIPVSPDLRPAPLPESEPLIECPCTFVLEKSPYFIRRDYL